MLKSHVIVFGGVFLAALSVCAQNPAGNEERPRVHRILKSRINTPEYKVSNLRIDKIKSILKSKYDQRVKLPDPAVRKSIEAEVGRLMPLVPKEKPDSRTMLDVKKALQSRINAKYPADLGDLRKKAEKEFDRKNPLIKRNSDVTVQYRRGNRIYRYSGRYYGPGLGGNTIRINSRNIPVVDLMEESLRQFDPHYHAAERTKYANEVVKKYLIEKNRYANNLIKAEYTKVRKNNEQRGYILRNGWEPAKNILNDYYKEMLILYQIREEEEAKKRAEALKNNPVQAIIPAKPAAEEESGDEEDEDEDE